MPNNQTNKPRLVFRPLVAAGLVSFAAWSVAQIPAGWTVISDGGCLKPSNQSKLNDTQKNYCESARIIAGSYELHPYPELCANLGGIFNNYLQRDRCKKP
jgi:hypothetical protein